MWPVTLGRCYPRRRGAIEALSPSVALHAALRRLRSATWREGRQRGETRTRAAARVAEDIVLDKLAARAALAAPQHDVVFCRYVPNAEDPHRLTRLFASRGQLFLRTESGPTLYPFMRVRRDALRGSMCSVLIPAG